MHLAWERITFARMHRRVLTLGWMMVLLYCEQRYVEELIFIGCIPWVAVLFSWVCVFIFVRPAARDYYRKDFDA